MNDETSEETFPSEDLQNYGYYEFGEMDEKEQLRKLEEEQDQLNSSLIALTTHFAQVQFRLKQIVDAESEDKEALLKDLEEFAFRSIPNITQYESQFDLAQILTEQEHEEKLEMQRTKQKHLIDKLKEQLEDLEHYAYETGGAGMPQSMLLERQSVIIEQLKGKLLLNLDQLDKLSPDELRLQVDAAIKALVNPVKMKEQLVGQLKTQITDLERFIEFLQGESASKGDTDCTCDCPVHKTETQDCHPGKHLNSTNGSKSHVASRKSDKNGQVNVIVQRVLTLIRMFVMTQFGCGRNEVRTSTVVQFDKEHHYGALRARLEVAINSVEKIVAEQEPSLEDSDYTSDSEDVPVVLCNERLTTAVRKELSSAIRDLMQHGLMPIGQSTSVVSFGCFPVKSILPSKMMHAWDLVLKYYELKNGYQYNTTAARKLCQSFNLEIIGGIATTPKQSFLYSVGNILNTHAHYKRSADSQFKALICAALNENCLSSWLRLLYRSKYLLGHFYQPWSYASMTGFDDALRSLDQLSSFKFDLPVDLAIRQLQNIKDAF